MPSPAASVALDKQRKPERYCPAIRCLWRTGDGTYCPRHAPRETVAGTQSYAEARDSGYGHAAGIAATLARADARRAKERD